MSILRAACYSRVSTQEQALHGYSIATQLDVLTEHCQTHDYKLVAHYTDEGISGAKPLMKRPALARMLEDVKAGKIDIILFTKLDRYFRSVSEYYKAQDILDDNHVQWKAILEDYDTTSANGRFAITIFLAIAQNERDKTSERIKLVFDHKLKNKEVCFGGNPPIGYKKVRDENNRLKLVKDSQTQYAMEQFWHTLISTNNLSYTMRFMENNFNIIRSRNTWKQLSNSTLYFGEYKGIQDFCEPYVTKEQWQLVQNRHPIKEIPKAKTYIFSGLIRCPVCGHSLAGNSTCEKYKYYRCKNYKCAFNKSVSESKLESQLIQNLEYYIANEIANIDVAQKATPSKNKINPATIKEKKRRLTIAYLAGNLTDEEYQSRDKELTQQLKAATETNPPTKNKNHTQLKALLKTNFLDIYNTLSAKEKQSFWQTLIEQIPLTPQGEPAPPIFL